MGFRFRKSFKIAPGVRLNLSKSGISTTVGVRGFSVNTGKRGTYLNAGLPGTGIRTRTRLDTSSRARYARPAASGSSGSLGYWCVGGVIVFLCIALAGGGNRPAGPSYAVLNQLPPAPYPQASDYETFYLHGTLAVRAAPNARAAVVRMLHRGDSVRLGKKDASGWAAVSEPVAGYMYRASKLVRAAPPAARRGKRRSLEDSDGGATASRRHTRTAPRRSESSGYYVGPRGGCYTYSASGRKRYVDRSFCS